MDGRLRGSAARARPGRGGGAAHRPLGSGCDAARTGSGTRLGAALPGACRCCTRCCRHGSVVPRTGRCSPRRGRRLLRTGAGTARARHRPSTRAEEAFGSGGKRSPRSPTSSELGAAAWIEKARGELGKGGGRTREDGLSAAERRVAVLVAAGRTNREVAAQLFLAERTVAGHLTRVYAKLGVRSRTELARRLR